MDNKKYNWSELWAEPFVSGGGGGGGGEEHYVIYSVLQFIFIVNCG